MFELLNGEEFYTFEEVPYPKFTLFEELYETEIQKYAIYNDILSRTNTLSFNHTSINLNILVPKDSPYWKHVINNWDILKLFYENYSVWQSYLYYIAFSNNDTTFTYLEEFMDSSLDGLSDICQKSDRFKTLLINILENSYKYFTVSKYKPFVNNRKCNPTDATNIVKKINRRRESYNTEFFLDFCIKYKIEIKELDYDSISLLHKLSVIQNLTA